MKLSVLLITYDLNKETVRPKITDAIHKYSSWAKLSESSYAISTNLSPDSVYGELKKFLDKDDQLYVINLRKPYSGQGDPKVNEWLEHNLPR